MTTQFDEAVVALRDAEVDSEGKALVDPQDIRTVLDRLNELTQERHDDKLRIRELEDAAQ